MKKLVCFILVLSVIFLFGCSQNHGNSNLTNEASENSLENVSQSENTEQVTEAQADYQNEKIVLPDISVLSENFADKIKRVNSDNFAITEIIGDKYYGYKSVYTNGDIFDEFVLIDSEAGKETALRCPENTENWLVGSGSTVVLQDRYLYEWKSYTSEISESSDYDVKLLRIDAESGVVEIVDELKYSTPLIYMCKLSETENLSYSVSQAPSDKTEYAVISSAWIYDINGDKREIINEKYENNSSWTDSQGILIERFAIKDGEIFGLGRRLISGKYQFFLYRYDKNGKLLSEESLMGFENIIGSEQMVELHLAGDYIVFRTYETLTTYICKKTDMGTKLIMKGADQQVQYAIANKYIFFIESNVNVYSG